MDLVGYSSNAAVESGIVREGVYLTGYACRCSAGV